MNLIWPEGVTALPARSAPNVIELRPVFPLILPDTSLMLRALTPDPRKLLLTLQQSKILQVFLSFPTAPPPNLNSL